MHTIEMSKKLKVLYVEDSMESRTQASKLLENYFPNIDIGIDGKDGIEKYKDNFINTNSHYDLVITDIEMPKMNGIEMSEAIYALNKNQKIIVVSAYSDKKYFINLINLGVEGFLQKPLSFEQVSDAMSRVCEEISDSNITYLSEECSYNKFSKEFIHNEEKIHLTGNECKFLELLIQRDRYTLATEEIFNHIYYDQPDREFSIDSIKGLVKRLRKKLPNGLILYNATTGYSVKINKNL